MKSKTVLWQLMGFALTSFFGTVLHFLYEWLGKPNWIAPFSGVNESTWEHMKLLFWPMVAFAVFQSFFFKDYENFPCVKLKGILLGLVLIPVLFYTYNGVVGKSPDWINIAIFFVAAAIAYIYEGVSLNKGTPCKNPRLAVAVLCGLALLFVVFTFATPKIRLFMDPLTGAYGIQ